jgi:hypothetical protein
MTLRAVLSVIALVCGALVAASGANASIVITGGTQIDNAPGTASEAFFLLSEGTYTNPDTTTESTTVEFGSTYTAPTGSNLLLTTETAGFVGTTGDNSANLLKVTGLVAGNADYSPFLTPDITSSGVFNDNTQQVIFPLGSPFTIIVRIDITLGAGASVDLVSALQDVRPTDLTPTPLPAALPLFATGIGGLGLLGWRRKRKAQAVA